MRNNNKEARQMSTNERVAGNGRFRKSLLVSAIAAVSCINVAHAQEAADSQVEEVVVTGSRATIQSTINIKRNSTTIVDGLSATDIGDMPALSIGEALENITGAASHRENGGATEISIRGLGPYLSATTFNGRGATNGSGDRSVNFSQFPSELVNKIAIYKTQDASLIEGGVAGLIALETVKPLEYGKRRIQVEAKANYNPKQANISDPINGDLGFRGTASYVDQFEIGSTSLGLSIGYQKSDISQPEQEMRSSSPSGTSLWACLYDPEVTNEGFYRSGAGDCEDQVGGSSNQGYNTTVDPETGKAISDGSAWGFAPSSNGYRQNDTEDTRDAFFAAVQFQPIDELDINFDIQKSERTQAELRHDLNFANMKRVTPGVTDQAVVISPSGAVSEWQGETAIESNSETYTRVEEYLGYGLNVAYDLTDDITISADYAFSETTRKELQVLLRTQSDNEAVDGSDAAGGYRPMVSWDLDSGIRQYEVVDFDVTDHNQFSDRYRVRLDNDVDRTNTLNAFRADVEWRASTDFVTTVKGGVRFSELEYLDLGSQRTTMEIQRSNTNGPETIAQINQACAIDFPESNFLSAERDGALVTQLNSEGAVVGTANSWATFDTMCAARMIANFKGEDLAFPTFDPQSEDVTDVTETTTAAYVMADFESSFKDTPVRGNFGVRVVQTEVESVGYRTQYTVQTSDTGSKSLVATGDLESITNGGDYTELLPSVNVIVDLTDELMLRGAVYRGLSRPDPADLGYKRTFGDANTEDETDDGTSLEELLGRVSGDGNPNMQPLTSWNFDAAIEWYANDDTMLGFGVYHKNFQGGFETIVTNEEFTVDGESVNAEFNLVSTNDETNALSGFEINASHNFSYLPGAFSGLGVKGSFNHARSDFEFEDSNYGDVTVFDEDGTIREQKIGIVDPGNVPGFSKNVFSGEVYYQIGEFDTSLRYKYRSEYFQPYTSNGTRLRYVGDVGVWEARVSYKVTKNVKLSLEAINLFDEPKKQYFYTRDNLGELNSYGPRIFFGVKAKF